MTRGSHLTFGVLLFAAVTFVAIATVSEAAPPHATSWSPAIVDGPARSIGFVGAGHIVVATGDAGAVGQGAGTACSPQAAQEDADLFLLSFPAGDGCSADAMIDTGSALGQEGVIDAAFAEARGRVIVGLPTVATSGGSSANLAAYDVVDGAFTSKFRVSAQGSVLKVATDPAGTTTVVAAQDGAQIGRATFRLNIFDETGVRKASHTLTGMARVVDVSDNGRYAAVGGNFTQGNVSFGWVHLYDLSLRTSENPVLRQEIRQARDGVVESLALTDDGQLFVGSAGGRAFYFSPGDVPLDIVVGNGTAWVDATADGSLIVAGAGGSISRLTGFPDELRAQWTHAVNGSVTAVAARGPYAFVQSGGVAGLHHSGELLWETDGGALLAINATGRGIAVASPLPPPGPGFKQTSTVRAAALVPVLTLTQLDTPPTISPGDIGVINVTLTNDGSALVNASLEADAPNGVHVSTFPRFVELLPGRAETLALMVDVTGQAFPGEVTLPLTVSSDPPSNATFNVTFRVGAATLVNLELQPSTPIEQAVVQGQQTRLGVILRNGGNADADISLEVRQFPTTGGAWAAALDPSTVINVPRDSVTTADVLLTVPDAVENGTRNHVIIRAVGQDGASAVAVDLIVNPFEGLALEPRRITKTLAPGGEATYRFTVVNTGTVVSNVTLDAVAVDADDVPYQPAGWTVLTSRTDAVLAPEETLTFQVVVNGPPGGTDGDRLIVQVQARTPDGEHATSRAFAVIDTSLAPPDREEPKREPLGPLIPLLALLAAALVLRRGAYHKP